jgi:dipeptidyl aminopeptidase/acylaminoacyl peptidase
MVALAVAAVLIAGMLPRPDGPLRGRLVYADSHGGLYLADANGQNPQKIQDGRFERPAWSPDGRFIAVVLDDRSGEVLAADSMSLEILTPGGSVIATQTASSVGDFQWAPGAESLLGASVDNDLIVWDAERLASTTVTSELGAWTWTSGSTIAWTGPVLRQPQASYGLDAARVGRQGTALAVEPLQALRFEFPIPPTHRGFGDLLLSPDGRTLASAARLDRYLASELVLIPTNGGLARPVGPHLFAAASVAWAADDKSVIAEAVNPRFDVQLVVVPLDGSPDRPLFDQALFDSWFLVGSGSVDLERTSVLIGRVPTNDRHLDDGAEMDLYALDPGANAPRALSRSVLGADVFWFEATQ